MPILDSFLSTHASLMRAVLHMQIYFPTVYDIKYLMKFCDNLHGGLNKLAEVLQVERIGPQHQVLQSAVHECQLTPCDR